MNMFFHGTSCDNYEDIINGGYIYCVSNMGHSTEVINGALEKFTGEDLRGYAVYLTQNKDLIKAYDTNIEINEEDLNTNLLYVADYKLANSIYLGINKGINKKLLRHYIKKYKRSIVEYSKYKEMETEYNKYHEPEFLYFGDIKVK